MRAFPIISARTRSIADACAQVHTSAHDQSTNTKKEAEGAGRAGGMGVQDYVYDCGEEVCFGQKVSLTCMMMHVKP